MVPALVVFAITWALGGFRRLRGLPIGRTAGALLGAVGMVVVGAARQQLIGVRTPRGLQGRLAPALGVLLALLRALWQAVTRHWRSPRLSSARERVSIARYDLARAGAMNTAFTTGC